MYPDSMKTYRQLDATSTQGPADWFSGEAWIRPVLQPDDSPSLRSAVVSFASGARTAWHTHPRGQMIHILSGVCALQREGGQIERLTAGDTAWFAPNEKHWHGSAPGYPMTHLAVQEADAQGNVVTWLEHVE